MVNGYTGGPGSGGAAAIASPEAAVASFSGCDVLVGMRNRWDSEKWALVGGESIDALGGSAA